MSSPQITPEVTWAQRSSSDNPEKNYVYLTISVPDVPKDQLKLDLKPTSLSFTGTSTTKKTTYHIDMELYAEIDPKESKTHHTAKNIEMVLRKKELTAEYWPRLLKDTRKMHYLKTDFDKWVDEDEQEEAGEEDYMNQFGGGMGGDGGFGGIDFSKLGGGAGGMPDMGDLGAGGDEEDDDEDMPELEDEKEAADEEVASGAAKGKGKIEEVS